MGYKLEKRNGIWGVYQRDQDGNSIGEPLFAHEDPEVAAAHLNAFTFQPAENKSADKPTGSQGAGERYADPGYQSDKQPRYPVTKNGKLSEGRIRAAWGYIHHDDNRKLYTSSQLSHIEGVIKAAAKEAGVAIEEDATKCAFGYGGASNVELLTDANYRRCENSDQCCSNCEYFDGGYPGNPPPKTGYCHLFSSPVMAGWTCDKWEEDDDPAYKTLFTGSSTFAAPADTSAGALVIPKFTGSTAKDRQKTLLDLAIRGIDQSEKLTLSDVS